MIWGLVVVARLAVVELVGGVELKGAPSGGSGRVGGQGGQRSARLAWPTMRGGRGHFMRRRLNAQAERART